MPALHVASRDSQPRCRRRLNSVSLPDRNLPLTNGSQVERRRVEEAQRAQNTTDQALKAGNLQTYAV